MRLDWGLGFLGQARATLCLIWQPPMGPLVEQDGWRGTYLGTTAHSVTTVLYERQFILLLYTRF